MRQVHNKHIIHVVFLQLTNIIISTYIPGRTILDCFKFILNVRSASYCDAPARVSDFFISDSGLESACMFSSLLKKGHLTNGPKLKELLSVKKHNMQWRGSALKLYILQNHFKILRKIIVNYLRSFGGETHVSTLYTQIYNLRNKVSSTKLKDYFRCDCEA